MNRRSFLAAGAAGAAALAGCSGTEGSGTDGDDPDAGATATPASSAGGVPDHPATAGLDGQPTLGPPPEEAPGLIVAFEDPSCPRCRAFEQTVVPEIRSKLVDPGRASFAFRGYPVVYEWGGPAVRALEATFARDSAAFWSLVAHYFENQGDFQLADTDGVYAATRRFLDEQTGVDAEAVVTAARDGEADAAVQTDLDAGMAAGAGRTTPHVFLFSDGQYRTKAAGSVSYETVESVLQV
jgi:protein-disulfide isomerase